MGGEALAVAMVAIRVEARINRAKVCTALGHRPREVEVVGPHGPRPLVETTDRQAHGPSPAEHVLDR
jgi:hypothetical protein